MCIGHGNYVALMRLEVLELLDHPVVAVRWTHTTLQGSSGSRHRQRMGQQRQQHLQQRVQPPEAAVRVRRFVHMKVSADVSIRCRCFHCHVVVNCSSLAVSY